MSRQRKKEEEVVVMAGAAAAAVDFFAIPIRRLLFSAHTVWLLTNFFPSALAALHLLF